MNIQADLLVKPAVWTVDDVLEASECEGLLRRVLDTRWLSETSELPRLPQRLTAGSNGRLGTLEMRPFALLEDPKLALRLWYRLQPHLPITIGDGQLSGLRPALRVLAYGPGEGTEVHADPVRTTPSGDRSELTLLVYLDDDFEGGDTEFPEIGFEVQPRRGRAVLFPHSMAHRGRPISRGEKHVLRTDVFYNPNWRDLPPL
jgi:hypothetical protein